MRRKSRPLKWYQKPFVIDSQAVEDRRVEVMDVHLVLDRSEPELVRGAVHVATPDSAAGHPHGETVVVVVATRERR